MLNRYSKLLFYLVIFFITKNIQTAARPSKINKRIYKKEEFYAYFDKTMPDFKSLNNRSKERAFQLFMFIETCDNKYLRESDLADILEA